MCVCVGLKTSVVVSVQACLGVVNHVCVVIINVVLLLALHPPSPFLSPGPVSIKA